MANAGYVLNAPPTMGYYIELMARADGIPAILDAVQNYLASWSKERVASLQKIDAGWAPFTAAEQPLEISDALSVRCIRDAIHHQCIALREVRVALTPELVELEEFFHVATEMVENFGCTPMQARAPMMRTPAIPTHADVFVNW